MSERSASAKGVATQIPERILSAAARVIKRQGFDGASLREIAAEAGLTKAGLYYHAESKESLLYAIHERFAVLLLGEAESLLTARLSASEKMRRLLKQHLKVVGDYQAEATVFLREFSRLSADTRAAIDPQRRRYRQILELIIQEGIESGEFRSGEVGLDAMAILGACNFATFWFDPDGRYKVDQIADAFADRFLAALRAPDADTGGAA